MARMSLALVGVALALAAVSPGLAVAGDATPTSGPAVGSATAAFNVQAVTGPQKGRSLCYV